ncbi:MULTISPECIES: FHA domain-containing protein [unclassified Coleofasciculus]|uniref:FHA domain-containing protein n=1 Tax=unclassified Coleofasciculus TaxID=2692782 RepID=UPI00187F42D7|nr:MULTISPECIES: FHA domain-containing protein [unclassified Coleofasciculus]MBE9126560.1 FHA domain-containing protein [Coleofasciculus sp. LEGE 07081]MBE9149994.1 FHA domain-containing protein [Coleofasciculus sp. LEGE 07092]
MQSAPLRIQLSWDDPATGELRSPLLSIPIALGRDFNGMPAELQGRRVSRMLLNSIEVSRFHLLIDQDSGGLVVIDQNSRNGTFVNGVLQKRSTLANGDTLQIGPYTISVSFTPRTQQSPRAGNSQIFFNPNTGLPDPNQPPPVPPTSRTAFPPPIFQAQQVILQDLHATGLSVHEIDYATIGAGLGSFVWVDFLRIYGVKPSQVTALGIEPKPYTRYKQLCLNSQIPLQERLRSNSDSCPDNIWGFPSYALREAWHDLWRGHLRVSLKYLWQVFAEPTFAETYTPRAGNVFDSLDREAKRIGWQQIFRYGSVRAIRKTDDGRYAIAYSRTTSGQRDHAFLIARYVHLATGYPAIKFLPDLQAYREKTRDFQSVVNAYEPHNHVYNQLERQGGTVLIRGRGIVASRIVQRVYEARQRNPQIRLVHLMRSPKPQGNTFGKSQRLVKHHYEFQPFNWPKACWSGELREMLEKAEPQQRQRLLSDWGGTTTADRSDWKHIVDEGLKRGWYKIEFGEVERVEREQNCIVTYIQEKNYKGQMRLEADFIIDATGLDANVTASPFLNDLVTHYNLPLNDLGRLTVSNEFELVEMRQSGGQMYAAGAITLGGSYAAVDSFLGLQYTALRAVDAIASTKSPRIHRLNALSSFLQWLKWVSDRSP